MPCYLVRVVTSKEAVGFVWADTAEMLFDVMDEYCTPQECEYLELEPGAIFFKDGVPSLPLPVVTDENQFAKEVEGAYKQFYDTPLHSESLSMAFESSDGWRSFLATSRRLK